MIDIAQKSKSYILYKKQIEMYLYLCTSIFVSFDIKAQHNGFKTHQLS
jgi:hypothetical protein